MGAYYFPALFRLINVQPPLMEHHPDRRSSGIHATRNRSSFTASPTKRSPSLDILEARIAVRNNAKVQIHSQDSERSGVNKCICMANEQRIHLESQDEFVRLLAKHEQRNASSLSLTTSRMISFPVKDGSSMMSPSWQCRR